MNKLQKIKEYINKIYFEHDKALKKGTEELEKLERDFKIFPPNGSIYSRISVEIKKMNNEIFKNYNDMFKNISSEIDEFCKPEIKRYISVKKPEKKSSEKSELKISDWEITGKKGIYDAKSKYHKKIFFNMSEEGLLKAICKLTMPKTCCHCDGDLEKESGDHMEMFLQCDSCHHGMKWTYNYFSKAYGWEELDF